MGDIIIVSNDVELMPIDPLVGKRGRRLSARDSVSVDGAEGIEDVERCYFKERQEKLTRYLTCSR